MVGYTCITCKAKSFRGLWNKLLPSSTAWLVDATCRQAGHFGTLFWGPTSWFCVGLQECSNLLPCSPPAEVVIFINGWITLVCYIILIGDFMTKSFLGLLGPDHLLTKSRVLNQTVITAFVLLPLSSATCLLGTGRGPWIYMFSFSVGPCSRATIGPQETTKT